jgi:hypothetical protein
MKCCIMLSLDFAFCLMHMLESLKFEFAIWLDLNSKRRKQKEKEMEILNKRKGKRSPSPSLSAHSSRAPAFPLSLSNRCVGVSRQGGP